MSIEQARRELAKALFMVMAESTAYPSSKRADEAVAAIEALIDAKLAERINVRHQDDCECVVCEAEQYALTGHYRGCGVYEGTQRGPCFCAQRHAQSVEREPGVL